MGSLDIISITTFKKLVHAVNISNRSVGILVDRKGIIKWVIVGEASRLYLPDIGRWRGGLRLRGLRLLVAKPNPLPIKDNLYVLSDDFKTDLEKLRLDAVLEIDASNPYKEGPLVLGFLAKADDISNKIITKSINYRSAHELGSFIEFINTIEDDINSSAYFHQTREVLLNKDRALLVGVYALSKKLGQLSMNELNELAYSAQISVADQIYQWRSKPDPKTIIGKGKLEEICLHALSLGVEVIIFDRDLTPSQLMNITDITDLKVLDRTMLILDIFAQRAVTKEGKLQVELAQLIYSLPRLSEKQTGLSRLTGGIGGRGPGETKLEVNRRRVKEKIARISLELKKIKKQRELRRKERNSNNLPTLAIVGYTNAGKSTLLNTLCGANIYAKDELFATLDPHSRRLRFPNELDVIITDTVGFIENLPQTLMQAFMATLEELNEADILIHVVDIANENFKQQINAVNQVLNQLNLLSKPIIMVFNKIDKLTHDEALARKANMAGVLLSAQTGDGLKSLIDMSASLFAEKNYLSYKKYNNMPKKSIYNNSAEEMIFDHRSDNKL